MTYDFDCAALFLSALDGTTKTHCFQTFDDDKNRRDRRLARIFHGTLGEHVAKLNQMNRQGAGVFVTINATDGRGRLKSNITRMRAVWQDDDDAWTGVFPLAPSIVVQSSLFKFQRYWLVNALSFDEHAAVMERLSVSFGNDRGARDIARVLRLPGFFHMKNPTSPHRVELIEANGLVYMTSEIMQAFPPIFPDLSRKSQKSQPLSEKNAIFERRDFERLKSALADIPADDRSTWFRVAAALKSEFGDAARDLFDGWSATSAKYDGKTQEKVWRSLRGDGGIGLGTIYHMAREHMSGGRHA